MSEKKEKGKKLPIRVDLDSEDAKIFEGIKDSFNLKNKAEVLRFCIYKVHHGTTLDIDEGMMGEINKMVSIPDIRTKYAISDVNGFIKRSIAEFLNILRKEWSLQNWNMRQTLSDEENDIALALLELQLQKIPGVTIDDLVDYLKIDKNAIQPHLQRFIADALIDFRESHDKIYYYVQ